MTYEEIKKTERGMLYMLFFFLDLDFNSINPNEILKVFEKVFKNNGDYQLERLKIQTNLRGRFEGIVNYVCALDDVNYNKLFKYYEPKIKKSTLDNSF